jgi:hypothetical protein
MTYYSVHSASFLPLDFISNLNLLLFNLNPCPVFLLDKVNKIVCRCSLIIIFVIFVIIVPWVY